MIITVFNSKGGAGKTATTALMAAEIAHHGMSVIIVDTEISTNRESSTNWVNDRAELHPEVPQIDCIHRTGNIHDDILELEKSYDVVIVDGCGVDAQATRVALSLSNVSILALTPHQKDLRDTLELNCEILNSTAKPARRRDRRNFALFGMVPRGGSNGNYKKSQAMLNGYIAWSEVPLTVVKKPVSYSEPLSDAFAEGLAAADLKKASNVKAQVQIFFNEVFPNE